MKTVVCMHACTRARMRACLHTCMCVFVCVCVSHTHMEGRVSSRRSVELAGNKRQSVGVWYRAPQQRGLARRQPDTRGARNVGARGTICCHSVSKLRELLWCGTLAAARAVNMQLR